MQNAECKMQNAECKIKNFTYYKYVESDFKQMRARLTRADARSKRRGFTLCLARRKKTKLNPLAQFTKRK